VNAHGVRGIPPFDPSPFSLLGLMVAVEAVVLSSFILMRQNRMTKRAERRDHLNLQIDLIAEKEVTKLLQMVRALRPPGAQSDRGRRRVEGIYENDLARDLNPENRRYPSRGLNPGAPAVALSWPSSGFTRAALPIDSSISPICETIGREGHLDEAARIARS